MNILILGINYAPEMVGIGPYTAGMAQFLAQAGHHVTVICGKPYYPDWKVDPAFMESGIRISSEEGVRIVRVPIYVPANPTGARRLAHHFSFSVLAQVAMRSEIEHLAPDVVIGIAPSLISMIAARDAARRSGAKLWLHVQDFEVEAAFATGLIDRSGLLARPALRFERWALEADRVSTISPQMCAKLRAKGVPDDCVIEFRNWANTDEVVPFEGESQYRQEWGINRPHIALYSGNIANKQGIEIVLEAASLLKDRTDLMFIVCGNGPNRTRLVKQSQGLDNIQFHDLQPRQRLSELLGLATVHLLPQIGGAADLVLPSKLTNILASGRPVIATASGGTGLANEVVGSGLITPPGDAPEFAKAIVQMIDDPALRKQMGDMARAQAVEKWGRISILGRFSAELSRLVEEKHL